MEKEKIISVANFEIAQTPKSKLPTVLAILLLIVVVFISGIWFEKYYRDSLTVNKNENLQIIPTIINVVTISPTTRNQKQENNKNDNLNSYKRIGECRKEECLFENSEAVEGYGKIKGYYREYEATDWGDTQVKCSAIITTGGSKELIDSLTSWIKKGNGVNKINDSGELMINIEMSDFDLNLKQQIISSSQDNQLEFSVIRRSPRAMGASTCTSFIDILSINKL